MPAGQRHDAVRALSHADLVKAAHAPRKPYLHGGLDAQAIAGAVTRNEAATAEAAGSLLACDVATRVASSKKRKRGSQRARTLTVSECTDIECKKLHVCSRIGCDKAQPRECFGVTKGRRRTGCVPRRKKLCLVCAMRDANTKNLRKGSHSSSARCSIAAGY